MCSSVGYPFIYKNARPEFQLPDTLIFICRISEQRNKMSPLFMLCEFTLQIVLQSFAYDWIP